MEDETFNKMCRKGQILWKKHVLMRDDFQNANSMDCLRYEEHIKYCEECRKALGLIK